MEFEPVIGLEVHAQLLTRSKLFCACSTRFGAPPNSQTCPVCLGLPGALPVVNSQAIAMGVRAALALGCAINRRSIFARKNYFYPDLPKGYQISQYDQPLAERGRVEVFSGERTERGNIANRRKKSFRITRLHLEEDAGKSLHEGSDGGDKSYVNLNRSGVPLAEIVSEPDFRSSQEAYDYLQHLRRTLLYVGVCDGNMEEGSLRCDANVSVRLRGAEKLGTRVEIKNLNSFRFLQKALDFEIERQSRVLAGGGEIHQETRLWDEARGSTFVMRSKEEAHDYRYFPEPDLPPLELDPTWIEDVAQALPELPGAKAERFVADYQLALEDALLLSSTAAVAAYFEDAARVAANPRAAANWITGDLAYALKAADKEIDASPVGAEALGELVKLVESGTISGKIGKTVFEEMFRTGERPAPVVERLGLVQISDTAALAAAIEKVKAASPKELAGYRAGKEKLFGYFVGQVMKETRGQANPTVLRELLLEALKE
jgi:aspartyl-tRNA(Asn)/glutamyl-tRNA(Gln) amidotransferase subunit B